MTFADAVEKMFDVPQSDMFFIVFIALGLAVILCPPWGPVDEDS